MQPIDTVIKYRKTQDMKSTLQQTSKFILMGCLLCLNFCARAHTRLRSVKKQTLKKTLRLSLSLALLTIFQQNVGRPSVSGVQFFKASEAKEVQSRLKPDGYSLNRPIMVEFSLPSNSVDTKWHHLAFWQNNQVTATMETGEVDFFNAVIGNKYKLLNQI